MSKKSLNLNKIMKNTIKNTISYGVKALFVLAFVFFGTKAFATEMVTLTVSNIGTTSVTVSARAQGASSDTTIRGSFEYATNPSFIDSNYTNETKIILSETTTFTQTITGLTPNTTYYVRALGIGNQEGVAKPGSTLTFKTDKVVVLTKPTVAVTTASATGKTTATVELFYNDNGSGNVNVWFEYGTSSSYGLATTAVTKTGFGNYQTTISGLNENTTYYVRAVAKNSVDTVYSSSALMFKTDTTNGNGNNNPTYVYGCMNPADQNYNPNANYHVESYCYGTNNNNNNGGNGWGWVNWNSPWLSWGNTGNNNYSGNNTDNNNYNHGSYTNPDDLKKDSSKSSTTTKSTNTNTVVKNSTSSSKDKQVVDANQYLASAMFGFGNGFFPTTFIGWLLLIFLILLLIVLTRHYFNKKKKEEVKPVKTA